MSQVALTHTRCTCCSLSALHRLASRVLPALLAAGVLTAGVFTPAQAQQDPVPMPLPEAIIIPDTNGISPSRPAPADATPSLIDQSWLTYKGNPQRTGGRNTQLPLPLNLLWQHTTDADPAANFSSPLVAGLPGQRRVYFNAGQYVYGVDAQTGSQVWRSSDLGSGVAAPLTFMGDEAGDLILAATFRGQLYALRASDGTTAWQAETNSAINVTAPTLIQTPAGERIVLGTGRGLIIAFTREGERDSEWEIMLGRYGSAPTSSPVVSEDGQRLFITAQDSYLYCININTREILFTQALDGRSRSTPLILRGVLVVTSGQQVTAYRESNGALLWRQSLPHTINSSPSGLLNADGSGTIFIGTSRGLFTAFDIQSGKQNWQFDLESSITGTPLVLPHILFIGASNGVLFGLDPATGQRKWQYRMDTRRTVRVTRTVTSPTPGVASTLPTQTQVTQSYGISSMPALAGEQVFVLADNAALYAFDTTNFDIDPPRLIEPAISNFNAQGRLQPMLLTAGRRVTIPGRGPIYFAVEMEDFGSGINPDSLQVNLNNQPIDAENILFQPSRNVLTLTLRQREEEPLPDGTYTLTFSISDYRGNQTAYSGTFTVTNPPEPT